MEFKLMAVGAVLVGGCDKYVMNGATTCMPVTDDNGRTRRPSSLEVAATTLATFFHDLAL